MSNRGEGPRGIVLALRAQRDLHVFTLTLMTWNIKGHAAARNRGHLAGIVEVIAAAAADVVCLQEVHCRTRKAGIDQRRSWRG